VFFFVLFLNKKERFGNGNKSHPVTGLGFNDLFFSGEPDLKIHGNNQA
jgi:hypothetical protein